MRKIGLVGLGNMGLPIAGRIVQAGFSLVAYNRTKAKQDALRGKAEMVGSQREVAESADSIIIAVSDTTAVEEVMFSSQGMYERIAAGKTVINCSDILPSTSKRIMEKLKRKNINYLEVPLVGGPVQAKTGDLVALVSGDRTRYEENLDVLKTFASKVFFIGPVPGAMYIKLALNHLSASYAQSIAEGSVLVEKAGLDPSLFIQIVNSTGFKTSFSEIKAMKMVKGSLEPTLYLRHMLKDLDLTDQTAEEMKVFLPLLQQVRSSYLGAYNMGYGDRDYSAIVKFIKDVNRMK
ncbi:MAG: NAD(P)-dependent oxidoreductase [Conexivisphaerales archaeon]